MILTIGEILFDLFPQGRQLGGAPFNFAYHLKQMGLPCRFISRVGQDAMGKDIHGFLSTSGFDLSDVPMDPNRPTGTVRVSLTDKGPLFTITPNTAWEQLDFEAHRSDLLYPEPDMVYFGSLIQKSAKGRSFVERMMGELPRHTRVFVDLNLRPGSDRDSIIDFSLASAHILKLNWEEMVRIWAININGPRLDHAIRHQMASHGLDLVILTLGSHGSLWVDRNDCWEYESTPPPKLRNTVGAGDAYSAVCAAGILRGLPPLETMELASRFAGTICGSPGALPEHPDIYRYFRQKTGTP